MRKLLSILLVISMLAAMPMAAFAANAGSSFPDVTPGIYCYDAVNWAVENGVTNGPVHSIIAVNSGGYIREAAARICCKSCHWHCCQHGNDQ